MKSEKPKKGQHNTRIHTSFRISQALLDRIDDIAKVIEGRQVGKVNRADVLREILADGVIRFENSLVGKAGPKVDP
jgi:hypothetical protein